MAFRDILNIMKAGKPSGKKLDRARNHQEYRMYVDPKTGKTFRKQVWVSNDPDGELDGRSKKTVFERDGRAREQREFPNPNSEVPEYLGAKLAGGNGKGGRTSSDSGESVESGDISGKRPRSVAKKKSKKKAPSKKKPATKKKAGTKKPEKAEDSKPVKKPKPIKEAEKEAENTTIAVEDIMLANQDPPVDFESKLIPSLLELKDAILDRGNSVHVDYDNEKGAFLKIPSRFFKNGLHAIKKPGKTTKTFQVFKVNDDGTLGEALNKGQMKLENLLNKMFPNDEPISSEQEIKEEQQVDVKAGIKKQNLINQQVIELLKSKDSNFSDEEKELLSQYEGDGGQAKNNNYESDGNGGLLYEYYTPRQYVNKIWDVINPYFSEGDSILEPSAGTGRFAEAYNKRYNFTLIEPQAISHKISKILIPNAEHKNHSFEELFYSKSENKPLYAKGGYDGKKYKGVVGNPPYGEMTGYFGKTECKGYKRKEDYFLSRSIDSVEEGGIVAMVVPSSFLGRGSSDLSKKKVFQKAELLDAYRFPEGTFPHTNIGTDLIILRKNTLTGKDVAKCYSDNWFEKNPDKILGEVKQRVGRFKKIETYVAPLDEKGFLNYHPANGFSAVPMSEEHKRKIAEAMMGNQNALGSGSGKAEEPPKIKKPPKGKPSVKDIVNEVTGNSDTYTAEEFRAKYQPDVKPEWLEASKHLQADGSFKEGFKFDKELSFYHDKKYFPPWTYTTGDISEKIIQLEEFDKDEIIKLHGEEHYKRQKELLESAKPKHIPLKDIVLNPIESFAKNTVLSEEMEGETSDWYRNQTEIKRIKNDLYTTGLYKANTLVHPDLEKIGDLLGDIAMIQEPNGTYTLSVLVNERTGKVVEPNLIQLESGIPNKVMAMKLLDYVHKNKLYSDSPSELQSPISRYASDTYTRVANSDLTATYRKMHDEVRYGEHEGLIPYEYRGRSLLNAFILYVGSIPERQFELDYGIRKKHVVDYLYGNRVGTSQAEKEEGLGEEIREKRKNVAIALFKGVEEGQFGFIDTLPETVQKAIENEWNHACNSFNVSDPTKIPLRVEGLAKKFRGKELKLNSVQHAGVAFATNVGSACLVHQVGVGKTIEGIMAGVNAMQTGRAKRPLFVVPPHLAQKWVNEVKGVFPNVNVDLFSVRSMKEKLKDLQDGQHYVPPENTLTIMTETAFREKFGWTESVMNDLVGDLVDQFDNPDEGKPKKNARDEEIQSQDTEQLAGLMAQKTDPRLKMDKAMFDFLCVDEAHRGNKILMSPKLGGAADYDGIAGGNPSVYGRKMWLAGRHILKNNHDKNVLLLTATPFTNNPLEVYSFLSLVAKSELEKMGIYTVKNFLDTFVATKTEYTAEASGKIKQKQTVRHYQNAHALVRLIKQHFDYKTGEDAGVKRPDLHVETIQIPETEYQSQIRDFLEFLYTSQSGPQAKAFALMSINGQLDNNVSPFIMGKHSAKKPHKLDMIWRRWYNQLNGLKDSNEPVNPDDDMPLVDTEAIQSIGGLPKPPDIAEPNLEIINKIKQFYSKDRTSQDKEKFINSFPAEKRDEVSEYVDGKIQSKEHFYAEEIAKSSNKMRFVLDAVGKFHKEHNNHIKNAPMSGQVVFVPRGVNNENDYLRCYKAYICERYNIPPECVGIMDSKVKKDSPDEEKLSPWEQMKKDFNDPNHPLKIILGTPAIDEGADLNGNTAVSYNLCPDWSPTRIEQRKGRSHRQGNRLPECYFFNLAVENSIDSKLYQKTAEKTSRINAVFSETDKPFIDTSDVNPDDIKTDIIRNPYKRADLVTENLKVEEKVRLDKEGNKVAKLESMNSQYNSLVAYDLKRLSYEKEQSQKRLDDYKKRNPVPDKEDDPSGFRQYNSDLKRLEGDVRKYIRQHEGCIASIKSLYEKMQDSIYSIDRNHKREPITNYSYDYDRNLEDKFDYTKSAYHYFKGQISRLREKNSSDTEVMNQKYAKMKDELIEKYDRENKESGNYNNTEKWRDSSFVDSYIDNHVKSVFEKMNASFDKFKKDNSVPSVHEKDSKTGLWKSNLMKDGKIGFSTIITLFYGIEYPYVPVIERGIVKSEMNSIADDIFEKDDSEDFDMNENRRRIDYSQNSFVKKNAKNFDPNLYGGLHEEVSSKPKKIGMNFDRKVKKKSL